MQSDQPNHDPWYQPRTAEIIARGGEGFANSIGRGIENFASALSAGLEKKREESKRRANEFKGLAAYAVARGYVDRDGTVGRDLDEFRGFVQGKEAETIAAAEKEKADLQRREALQRIAAGESEAAGQAEFQRRYSNATGTLPMGGPDLNIPGMERQTPSWNRPVQPDSQNIFSMMVQSKMAPDDIYKNMRALAEGGVVGGAAQNPLLFNEDPVSGKRFATFGNSISPSGINPQKAATTEFPDVPGYVKVPVGDGSFKYLPNKPNAQQSLELSRQKDRRDSLKAQMQSYDTTLAADPNAKTSMWGGKRIADLRAELAKQLEDVNSRIADLGSGNDGAIPGQPKAKGGDLWQDFMNSQK